MQKKRVELINTGTELLLGRTLNTNAAWIGEKLFEAGLRLERQTTVPDGGIILEAMRESAFRAGVVLVTGGLGPTSDDVTREALSELCGAPLEYNQEVMDRLKAYFALRKREMSPSNEKQAMVPEGAMVIPNKHGTAPGLWMPGSKDGGRGDIVLLPGPPSEMRPMMEEFVLPRLASLCGSSPRRMKTLTMAGIGESALQDLVDRELSLIDGLEYGYCAHLGEVEVRLIGETVVVDAATDLLKSLVKDYLAGEDGMGLAETIVSNFREKGLKITTAESCTGGLIAKRITDVPGSSDMFEYGFVTYANRAKTDMLGVPEEMLKEYGAVSEPVAQTMAEGALRRSRADIAVAVTGIAGPGGGTPEKPVGTVWMAWAFRNGATETRHACFPVERKIFRFLVSQAILARLLKA